MIAPATNKEVCPQKLLRALQGVSNPKGDDFIFRGFNGHLVAKNPGTTTPMMMTIKIRAIHALPFSLVWRYIWAYF